MMPECNLQIELLPDIAGATQWGPAGMGNIGGARGYFREDFGLSAPIPRNRLLGRGVGYDDRYRLSNAGLCVSQLFP
jgi:hypothetical protein